MAIRKKPAQLKQEAEINAFIHKGGSPSHTITLRAKEAYRLTLRIPLLLKNQIDELIAADLTQPTLTTWILEAIKQKIQAEKQHETT